MRRVRESQLVRQVDDGTRSKSVVSFSFFACTSGRRHYGGRGLNSQHPAWISPRTDRSRCFDRSRASANHRPPLGTASGGGTK
jgi:hypothetical protein